MNEEITRKDMLFISILILILLFFTIVEPFQFSFLVGESMEPTISDGSLIVYTQHTEIEQNDIIVFSKGGSLIGHRVIDINGKRYITKGDNNKSIDRGIVRPKDIQGEVIFHTEIFNNESS